MRSISLSELSRTKTDRRSSVNALREAPENIAQYLSVARSVGPLITSVPECLLSERPACSERTRLSGWPERENRQTIRNDYRYHDSTVYTAAVTLKSEAPAISVWSPAVGSVASYACVSFALSARPRSAKDGDCDISANLKQLHASGANPSSSTRFMTFETVSKRAGSPRTAGIRAVPFLSKVRCGE
jgi:hypothetical protein